MARLSMLKSKPDPDFVVMLTEHEQAASGLRLVRLRVEDTQPLPREEGQDR